jgi:hypothetical protein
MNGAARPAFGEAFWQPFLGRAGTFATRLIECGVGFQEGDVIEEVSALLAAFDRRLAPILEVERGGKIEFVITANGNRSAFPIARRLVRAAPSLDAWRFIALKPRSAVDLRQSVTLPSGRAVRLEEIRVAMVASRRGVEIALLMPVDASDPESARRCRPLARNIVLELIGEEDLATCVIDVEVFPLSVLQPNSSTLSLGQLVPEFDRIVAT